MEDSPMRHGDAEIHTHLRTVRDLVVATACQLDPAAADVYDTIAILIEAAQGLLNDRVTGAVPESIRRLQVELDAARARVTFEALTEPTLAA
jgi:hypothetical protein